jgi:hypothetical protein
MKHDYAGNNVPPTKSPSREGWVEFVALIIIMMLGSIVW